MKAIQATKNRMLAISEIMSPDRADATIKKMAEATNSSQPVKLQHQAVLSLIAASLSYLAAVPPPDEVRGRACDGAAYKAGGLFGRCGVNRDFFFHRCSITTVIPVSRAASILA